MEIFSLSQKETPMTSIVSVFLERLYVFQHQEYITIGLSGGTSLISFYEGLRDSFMIIPDEIQKKIRFAFLDERLVSLDNPESNYHLIDKILFSPLVQKKMIRHEQIHIVKIDDNSPATQYTIQVSSIDI